MLIDRLIATQILLCTGISTATLSVVLVFGNVFKEVCDLLVNHRVPLVAILEFIACAAPFCLTYTLPWGFLTAVFLVFGRMAADKELLAIHTSGVPIGRVCRSVFVIALLLSLFCFWINAEINPRARLKMRGILHSLAISTLLNDTASERILNLPHARFYVGSQDAGRLKNVQIYEFDEESALDKIVFAKRGWLESAEETDELVIHLEDATIDEHVPSGDSSNSGFRRAMSAETYTYSISFFALWNKYSPTNYKSLGSYTLAGLREGFQPGPFQSRFFTEFNKRISVSLASLSFALAGIPLAILLHRKETTLGFGCGLLMACLYYLFIMIADNCRDNPATHPEFLAWASNGFFIPLGGVLFWRLGRH